MPAQFNRGGQDDAISGPPLSRAALRARRRAQVRRRRAGALTAIGAVVVLIVLVASGGGRHANLAVNHQAVAAIAPPGPRAAGRAHAPRAGAPRAGAPRGLLAREGAAIDRLLSRRSFIAAGGRERREVALTFDDGPGPYTPRLLDRLARLRVPATFFEVGSMIHYFYPSLERELRAGAAIGDHTEIHPMMARFSEAGQSSQILAQAQQLARYGGPFPRLYRPPYGSFDHDTFAILHRLRMLMVLWTVDTEDYAKPGVSAIAHRALAGARPGAIILMHDAGGDRTETIAALGLIARGLRARGYKLVTIPELILEDPPQGRAPAPPANLSGG